MESIYDYHDYYAYDAYYNREISCQECDRCGLLVASTELKPQFDEVEGADTDQCEDCRESLIT